MHRSMILLIFLMKTTEMIHIILGVPFIDEEFMYEMYGDTSF